MLDGEDAIAPGDEMAALAMYGRRDDARPRPTGATRTACRRCASTDRPASISRPRCATCTRCCGGSASWRRPGAFPLDGIVFPKVEHPEEVDLVDDLLDRAEAALDLPVGSIRVGLAHRIGLERDAARRHRRRGRAAPVEPDLRRGRLQRRPRPALHRQRPPPRGLGACRDRRGRRARSACRPSTA